MLYYRYFKCVKIKLGIFYTLYYVIFRANYIYYREHEKIIRNISIFKIIYIVASAERYISNARDTTDRHTLALAHSKIITRFFETQKL